MSSLGKALAMLLGEVKPVARSFIQDNDTYLSERYLIISDNVRLHIIVDTKVEALKNMEGLDVPQLNKLLDEAIKNEDYAKAAELRDIIERLTDGT